MKDLDSLFAYLNSSPSPAHAVDAACARLENQGFQSLPLEAPLTWNAKVVRRWGLGSFCAWMSPTRSVKRVLILAAHTDSPALMLKSRPDRRSAGTAQLQMEVYGGALWNSWLDRDLELAGSLWYTLGASTDPREMHCQRLRLEWGLRIPQLAIHLDRDVNTQGLKLNPQNHLIPLVGLSQESFLDRLQDVLPTGAEVLSWDLVCADQQKAALGGHDQSLIYSGRLDNLASVEALLQSFPTENLEETLLGIVCFHHEEVGSQSREGADGRWFVEELDLALSSLGLDAASQRLVRSQSVLLSVDAAHAEHPNYTERHDANNKPLLGLGPVLKTNANQRYATEGTTAAALRLLCKQHKLPLQDFHSRNDLGCGSTVGPSLAARLGMPSLDLGIPMLSMHSAREMCALADVQSMRLLLQTLMSQSWPELKTGYQNGH
jgi:aspartyl aminopeptidase